LTQPRRRNIDPVTATWSLVGSLVAHVAVVLGIGWIAYHSLSEREKREVQSRTAEASGGVIAIELPGVAEGTLLADRVQDPEGTAPTTFGGAAVARVDTGDPGRGGTTTGAPATNLAAANDEIRLTPDLLNRLDREQIQRLRTAKERATYEDRRATPNPMELTFVISGKGEHQERRPDSPNDPSRGSMVSHAPSVVGGHIGAATPDDDAPGGTPGSSRPGQLNASPGLGVREGSAGSDHRDGARIAYARPDVTEGAVTIPSTGRGRPNDTVDSDQEVASTVRSLVHASVAGGLAGDGRGGAASAAADPGAGAAAGRGSVGKPLGTGDGELLDWNTNDPSLLPYFRKIQKKVHPLWKDAFPKSAMVELKQGTVILEFTISADGSAKVSWPPVRPSGIDEFDRNCADAIRRASPFDPIPQSLRDQGRHQLRIRAPFDAKNPIIK
jgi:TonB family protein